MGCGMLIVMPLLLLLYVISQTRMIVRLVRLLRHPAGIAQVGLAANYITSLCVWPGLMLLLLTLTLATEGNTLDDANLLMLMTFTPYGAAFALCSWIAMALWFRRILRRDLAIYREPTALVPVVIMGLICLTFLAGVAWELGRRMLLAGALSSGNVIENLIVAAVALMLLYIPAAPLAGFVLLIVHVVRVRAAKTWETYVPDEQEEMP
jgi:hypothetical protein